MENIKWTDKNILTGKTLPVIVLTLAFHSLLFRLGDSLLYALIPSNAVYTIAMWVVAVVSLAASLLLSLKLLKFVCNKKLDKMDADAAEAYLRRESKFKWHLLFTIGICALAMTVVVAVYGAVSKNMDLTASESSVPSAILIKGVAAILACVFIIIGGKKLHWHMIQVTATNAELIDEVYCGLHDDKIPNGVTRSDIIGVLYNAAAYSVTTAAIVHVAVTVLKKFGKLMLKILGISTLIALVLAKVAGDGFERQMNEMVQGVSASMDATEQQNQEYAARRNATEAAKKKAQFSYRQAAKAYNYNPNSYDAYRKKNLFMNDYWKYQDIKKGK